MADIPFSVVYRKGPLTASDYDEAIEDLQRAKRQDECRNICCSVCEDTGHTAETCHHNPLLLARQHASNETIWRCYHCDFIASNHQEAEEHFGSVAFFPATCILKTQLAMVEKSIEDYPDSAIAEIKAALERTISARAEGSRRHVSGSTERTNG